MAALKSLRGEGNKTCASTLPAPADCSTISHGRRHRNMSTHLSPDCDLNIAIGYAVPLWSIETRLPWTDHRQTQPRSPAGRREQHVGLEDQRSDPREVQIYWPAI